MIVWEYLDRTPEPTAALDALETSNGDLVLTTSVDRDGGLTKLGPDGHALWAHRFEFDGWQYASKIQPAEGGYLLAGLSMDERSGGHTDVWLAKASLDGELVWQKSFGEPGEDDYATSLLRLPGGEYLVAGMGRGLPRWKVDGSGNVRWEQRIDDPAAYAAFGATALAGEGFLLWGVKVVVGARSFDGVLMRTDSSGACH